MWADNLATCPIDIGVANIGLFEQTSKQIEAIDKGMKKVVAISKGRRKIDAISHGLINILRAGGPNTIVTLGS